MQNLLFRCILREYNVRNGGRVSFGCNQSDARRKVNRQFEFITLEPVHYDDADDIKLCAKRDVDEMGLAVLRCFPTYFATGKASDIIRLKVLGPAIAATNTKAELQAAVEETESLYPRTEKQFVDLFAGRAGSSDAANSRYWNEEPQWIMATRMIKHGIMKPAPNDSLIRTLRFYPVVAHFKHSCDPNCRLVVDEDTHELTVTLLRPMSCGEAVTISYILTEDAATIANTPWTLRRDVLLKQYGFICDCTLCSVQSQSGITFDQVLAALS